MMHFWTGLAWSWVSCGIVLAALLFLVGCNEQPPPGAPLAGSINCTLDVRHCEPGMKR